MKKIALVVVAALFPFTSFGMEVAIPLYTYPYYGEPNWETALHESPRDTSFIIANVNDGPGYDRDYEWSNMIHRANNKDIDVYGYVYTNYGRRPPREVDMEIRRWFQLYPEIDGIFMDEVGTGKKLLSYYKNRYTFTKRIRSNTTVVLNPGTTLPESYMAAGDIITMFEGSYYEWKDRSFPTWMKKYGDNRFYAIVYETDSRRDMEKVVSQAHKDNIGHIYVTHYYSPSDPLPDYFKDLIDEVR
jgi:hypothetical protein